MKRITAVLLSLVMVFTCFHISFAKTFGDVNEKQYSWAVKQISEMADQGIINGYPDGTFGPANGITKLDAMLLIARILGINSSTYAPYLNKIYNLYATDLDDLNLDYEKEIAFLIYKKVFTVDEIKTIVQQNGFKTALKRYEVAMYLTKAMGSYNIVLAEGKNSTGYADESSIPAAYRPFVKFVKDQEIMLGMTATTFDPDFIVNRAQIAVMLHRVMTRQNSLIFSGTLLSIDAEKRQIKVDLSANSGSYDMSETIFYQNGEEIASSTIVANTPVILVFSDAVLKRVETFYEAPVIASTVTGEVKEVVLSLDKHVKITESLTGRTKTYTILDGTMVYVNGEKATVSLLRMKDYVQLSLNKNEEVLRVDILDVTQEYTTGTVKGISVEGDFKIEIRLKDGTNHSFSTGEDVVVKRNGKDALLREILVGDEISRMVTSYGKIIRLETKSEISNVSGVISEIVISAEPSIVIGTGSNKTRYPVNSSVSIILDGKSADIYDLRMDMNARVTTDSGTISKIEVTAAEEVGQISGKVTLVNASYGFINVLLSSGETKQVFVGSSTKITADGAITATKTIRNINVNDYVVIIGKTVNGAFQASTIVIVNQ